MWPPSWLAGAANLGSFSTPAGTSGPSPGWTCQGSLEACTRSTCSSVAVCLSRWSPADATMLCRRPLDDWLQLATAAVGFFAFSPERSALHWTAFRLPLMSSFLVARNGNIIVAAWLEHMLAYWSKPSLAWDLGYWALHTGFAQMTSDGNATARRAWGRVPRVTADWGVCGPHLLVPYAEKMIPPCTTQLRAAVKSDLETPMWKLSHHLIKPEEIKEQSCLRYVLSNTLEGALASSRLRAQGGPRLAAATSRQAQAEGVHLSGRHACRPSQRVQVLTRAAIASGCRNCSL